MDSSVGRKLNNVADLRASVPTVEPSRPSRGDHTVELSGVFEGIGDNSVLTFLLNHDMSDEPLSV